MSNELAIAAVTSTLRKLLEKQIPERDPKLADLQVTVRPPDLARKEVTTSQLNLFLYQTAFDAGWRNLDTPRQLRPGESGVPPLALNLHYLLTAYGKSDNDSDALSHRVLGSAMGVLHDHPLLDSKDVKDALGGGDQEPGEQFERFRVTPLSMGLEEMSKLWMTFQTQYRISAAYEITVVLIDSRRAPRSALPVLTRGPADRGPAVVPGGAPTLEEVRPPRSQAAARLGEDVALVGRGLSAAGATLRLTSARLPDPVELAPRPGEREGDLVLHVPTEAEDPHVLARLAPGFYTLSLAIARPGAPTATSNALALAIAPSIRLNPKKVVHGDVDVIVECKPRIVDGQRVQVLIGDRQANASSIATPAADSEPSTATFRVPGLDAGNYVIRVRVDGVDSLPVVFGGVPAVPSFDPEQVLEVT